MDTLPKVRNLYNDSVTNDLTLRIDGKIYFAHKCILGLQSEWFSKYFDDSRGGSRGEGKHLFLDFSCSKKFVVGKWYEYEIEDLFEKNDGKVENNGNIESQVEKKGNGDNDVKDVAHERDESDKKNGNDEHRQRKYDESAFRFEIYYDYDIFGYFLSYCYGWSIQPKTTDELFAVAYLAKKFEVLGLTKFTDCLLRHIPKSWKPNEYKWKVGLKISRWLVLVETRLSILKFLARILARTKDPGKIEMVKSIIDEEDSREVERLMAESSDETTRGQNGYGDEEQCENELFEDDVLGLDKNGDVIGTTGNIVCEQNSSDESSGDSSSSSNPSFASSPSEDFGSDHD